MNTDRLATPLENELLKSVRSGFFSSLKSAFIRVHPWFPTPPPTLRFPMAWQVEFKNGVWLPQIGWDLDAHFPTNRSFVSHAHFDHLATHREIICSEGTARLMRARMPGQRIEHVLPFGQTERLSPECTITLHPAGHIFGSAQSLLTHEQHGTLLYTGDFKLRRGLSAEPCETP